MHYIHADSNTTTEFIPTGPFHGISDNASALEAASSTNKL